jgi:probable F420-dependent oxidoreductase
MTAPTRAHRTRPPRFGVTSATPRGPDWTQFAAEVEAAGFDVVTLPDHLVPTLAPFAACAAAAAAATRLHTGTLVLNNDLRHPVDTAREAATLAALSGGRFELGLGAGHMKAEYDAAGLPFDSGATRVARLVEAVEIVRALLDGRAVDVDGVHYRVHAGAGELVAPPPHHVPLLVGGNGTAVLRLAGRRADIAGFAGFSHNSDATQVRLTHFGSDGLLDRIAVVREAAGVRFEEIELNVLIQAVVHTSDRRGAAHELAAAFGSGVTPEEVLASPFVLIGTHEQMADALVDRQRRSGVSYWTVFDTWADRESAVPDLTEVIRLLR